jgi:hypothetical protein
MIDQELLATCSGGIPFTGESVRGIREGRKTRTTRLTVQGKTEARPHYLPGKLYYVREARWSEPSGDCRFYAADCKPDGPEGVAGMWSPPMFMPRESARYVIEILTATPMRLHDITPAQILAEGFVDDDISRVGVPCFSARKRFSDAWDAINKDRAPWASNPRVVGYEFRLVTS